MKSCRRVARFLLAAIIGMLGTLGAEAQKIKLHAPLRGIETPLEFVKYPHAYIRYNDEFKELTVAGVEVITRDMIEKYKNKAKIVKIGTDVRAIDDFAFCDFTDLIYVYQQYCGAYGGLENHLQLIGEGAFKNCSKLEAIFMINRCGVTLLKNAFIDCPVLKWVDLNIKCMVPQAFVRCNKLKASDISGFDNIFYVGNRAFEDCRFIACGGERINSGLEMYGFNRMVKSIDFVNGIVELKQGNFDRYDLLPYFLALKEHSGDNFYVVVDETTKMGGAHKISEDIWELNGCRFHLLTQGYYDYLCGLHGCYEVHSGSLRGKVFSSRHVNKHLKCKSPETSSDEE